MPKISDPVPEGVSRQVGDKEANLLAGTSLEDELFGLGGNDTLVGNGGSDYLEGGDGNDSLTSGVQGEDAVEDHSPDRFAFDKDDGLDTITDFNPACIVCFPIPGMPLPGDKIVLLGGTQPDIETVAGSVRESKGGDAQLHYGDTVITMVGFPPEYMDSDFLILG
jgi:Ca2+-binding RTX toxin-like protein